jgi:hypothetical protein
VFVFVFSCVKTVIYVGIEKNFVREIRRDKTENANVSSLVVITDGNDCDLFRVHKVDVLTNFQ